MTLHVELLGKGPDLALLHGWGLHSGVWDEALPELAKRFRVHAVDLPGHGHSAAAPVGSLDDTADRIAAQLPTETVVCGWSLGGLVAQRLARLHPGKVRALILVSATPCFTARPGWPHAMKAAMLDGFAEGLHHDREATLASFVRLSALHGARGREAIRAFTKRLFDRGEPTAAALAGTLDWLREADLRTDAPDLPRTLVVHGARDALAPVEAGRWLAEHIPGAHAVEFADAAHIPFFTHRESFVRALESFVG